MTGPHGGRCMSEVDSLVTVQDVGDHLGGPLAPDQCADPHYIVGAGFAACVAEVLFSTVRMTTWLNF